MKTKWELSRFARIVVDHSNFQRLKRWKSIKLHKALLALSMALLVWISPCRLDAQLSVGSITGLVKDPSDAAVPNAEVRILNESTGIGRDAKTNESGIFLFQDVLPAVYEVTISASGFKRSVHKGVQLHVNQGLRLDVQLELGEQSERVEVTGTSALLESVNAKIGTIVETKQITELPLNGRQFAQLILLTPGALPIALGQSRTFKVQLGSASYAPVINGQRSRYQNFLLDGVENNDPMFNSYAMNPSVDAIQEFTVQSRGGVSEQGRSMGSDIVVATRSGTNAFHGAAWEFLRNEKLDARNFFDPARPVFKQNQFGGTIGGPVQLPGYKGRDRTFFFGYYEGFRYVRSSNTPTSVPTEAMRRGDFSAPGIPTIYDILTTRPSASSPSGYIRDPFPGNIIPQARLDKNALSIFASEYPLPTAPGIINNYINTQSSSIPNNQWSGRIDHKINDKNTIFGRLSWNSGKQNTPGGIPVQLSTTTNVAWNGTVSDSHMFTPNVLGHFQFGFNRYTSNLSINGLPDPIMAATGWDKLYLKEDLLVLGVGIDDINGAGGNFIPIGPHTSFQGISDVTWNRGKHSLKAGFTFNRLLSFQASPQASISFGRRPTTDLIDSTKSGWGPATFLLGLPTSSRRAAGDTSADVIGNEYHVFLQDEMRLTPRFTFTMGLRYSYVQAMKEKRDAYSGFDATTGEYLLAVENPVTKAPPNMRARMIDPDWNDFAPRVGLAYLLDPKTTIRAGAGIYYSYTDFPQVFGAPAGNWPFGFSENVGPLNDLVVDTPLTNPFNRSPGVVLPPSPEGQGGYMVDRRQRTPYSTQWNLSVQRQLPREMLFEVSYVGSNSVKLRQTYVINTATPGPGPLQARRRYPNYGPWNWESTGAPSNYNGVSMKVQKRFSSGLSFLTSYTWSHMLDIFPTERNNNALQNPLNWRPDYASSLQDIKHTFLFSSVYEFPFGKGKAHLTDGIASHILGNWQWSNIIGLYGGRPFNVTLGFDNASNGVGGSQRPDVTGQPLVPGEQTRLNWINRSAFSTPTPFTYGNAGRNLVRGPGLTNWDIGLTKNIPITERYNLQFRTEFFNAFNIVNFNNPTSVLSSSAFGVITGAGPSRSIQFSLKLTY